MARKILCLHVGAHNIPEHLKRAMRELAGPAGVEFVPIHPENGMELDTLSQAEDVAGVYLQERPLIAETLQRGEVPLLSANPNDRQLASVVAFNATYAPPRLRGD